MRFLSLAVFVAAFAVSLVTPADAASLDGKTLSLWWALPFVGILLCIATGPLLYHHVWEQHQGKIAAFWAALVMVPLALVAGASAAFEAVLHALLLEYMSFIILLFALFTISGGLLVRGNLHGSPATNTGLLALGTMMASVVGTTGAAMIMIRPLIRANDDRRHNVHVVVFFIFLVANIGGALTPLGDPPLFVGFLRGVDFFWTTLHLWQPMLFLSAILLAVFYAVDSYLYRKEGVVTPDPTPDSKVRIMGLVNVPLLLGVIAAILLSASWKPGVSFAAFGYQSVTLELQNLVRDGALLLLAGLSLWLTPRAVRDGNGFNWAPIAEVAKLFAAIFIAIVPVIAMLHAGKDGPLAVLVNAVTLPDGAPNNTMYFWMTGILSSLLDNAPTYLVFYELAGGNAQTLMGTLAPTLTAISAAAVFMGALTYIGNAPNFMVYAIARSMKVNMPSFFGYMLWSGLILLPLFVLMTPLFFR